MKKLLILLSFALVLFLAACGETTDESKEVSNVETTDSQSAGTEVPEEESNEDVEEGTESSYDQVLIDSETAKITLESISTVEDTTWDEEYHLIKLLIENKSDKTITVQTDEVSIDGLMVTDDVWFSEDVAGGRKANGEMQIQVFDGDLPPLEEELEMLLLVIDNDTFDTIDEEKVNIEIK